MNGTRVSTVLMEANMKLPYGTPQGLLDTFQISDARTPSQPMYNSAKPTIEAVQVLRQEQLTSGLDNDVRYPYLGEDDFVPRTMLTACLRALHSSIHGRNDPFTVQLRTVLDRIWTGYLPSSQTHQFVLQNSTTETSFQCSRRNPVTVWGTKIDKKGAPDPIKES
jgi:hypothetical protein